VTGDAYVDHPSFGMAIIGRLLEAQGFRCNTHFQGTDKPQYPAAQQANSCTCM